jgi:hypothetical protein
MALSPPMQVIDEITDFLATSPNPQAIIAFKPSLELERRALDLLQKNREAGLAADEQAEMEAFMQMDHFMTLLKAKARLNLERKK